MNIKQVLLYTIALLLFPLLMSAAIMPTAPAAETKGIYGVAMSETVGLTADDIMHSDRKAIEAKLGKKLSVKERLALASAKYHLKRANKKGQLDKEWGEVSTAAVSSSFLIGLLLGVLLSIIGIIIALIWGDKAAIRGSLIGALVVLLIVLLARLG